MLRKSLWNSLLDAEMNVRYWKCLASRFSKKDMYLKILLAILSSTTVASWTFWSSYPLVWKSLSSLVALVAIALPFLNLQKSIETMSILSGKWWEIRNEYDTLWARLGSGGNVDALTKRYEQIREKEVNLVQQETNLPDDKKLLKNCFNEVKKSYGIPRGGV